LCCYFIKRVRIEEDEQFVYIENKGWTDI